MKPQDYWILKSPEAPNAVLYGTGQPRFFCDVFPSRRAAEAGLEAWFTMFKYDRAAFADYAPVKVRDSGLHVVWSVLKTGQLYWQLARTAGGSDYFGLYATKAEAIAARRGGVA